MTQITSVTPIAKMVGVNRIVAGNGIVHILGDDQLSPEKERELRRNLVQQALDALRSPTKQQP